MARLEYSSSAEADLLDAWLYVAENNMATADGLLEKIDADARVLLHQPLMGRRRDELHPGLRSWPTSTPYILFYFGTDHGIIVARVLHHARDVPAMVGWPAQ